MPEIVGTLIQRSRAAAHKQDRGSYGVMRRSIGGGFAGAFLSAAWLPQLAITAQRLVIITLGGLIGILYRIHVEEEALPGAWASHTEPI